MKDQEKKTTVLFQSRMLALAAAIVIFCLSVSTFVFSGTQNDLSPVEGLESHFDAWFTATALQADTVGLRRDEAMFKVVGELFFLRKLGSQILQQSWEKISAYQKDRFISALQKSMLSKLVAHLQGKYGTLTPSLQLIKQKTNNNFASLEYLVSANGQSEKIVVYLLKDDKNAWKVSNAKVGKKSIMRYYYTLCDDILEDNSIEYLIAQLGEYGYMTLEDFENGNPDELPPDWDWRKQDNDKNKPYRLKVENGNQYLEATDEGESVILGKNIKWNLKKYPYISFKWRAHKLPEGGDERFSKTVDSAAGIYITYKFKFGLIPQSVKYVWSSTLPVGSAMRRSGVGRPWMVVAESGQDSVGEWHTYVFNAYEAYKKTFGGSPPDIIDGIGILSDANSIKSYAYADYDDIRALEFADADSGIKQKLKAE